MSKTFKKDIFKWLRRNNEYENYKVFIEQIDNAVLKTRADLSLRYYIKKAVSYKRLWSWLSLAAIILPAIATVASTSDILPSYATPVITACTTVTTGILALFKCADKKTSYRNSAENLKSELCAYASQKGLYSKDPAKNDELLFSRLESIIKEGYEKIEALEKDESKGTSPEE